MQKKNGWPPGDHWAPLEASPPVRRSSGHPTFFWKSHGNRGSLGAWGCHIHILYYIDNYKYRDIYI